MIIKVISKTDIGVKALEEHIAESQNSFLIKQMKKLEIEQTVIFKPLTVIIEWKAKGFLENIRFLKECYPRELQKKINENKLKIIKTMKKNKADDFIDYYFEVEV